MICRIPRFESTCDPTNARERQRQQDQNTRAGLANHDLPRGRCRQGCHVNPRSSPDDTPYTNLPVPEYPKTFSHCDTTRTSVEIVMVLCALIAPYPTACCCCVSTMYSSRYWYR